MTYRCTRPDWSQFIRYSSHHTSLNDIIHVLSPSSKRLCCEVVTSPTFNSNSLQIFGFDALGHGRRRRARGNERTVDCGGLRLVGILPAGHPAGHPWSPRARRARKPPTWHDARAMKIENRAISGFVNNIYSPILELIRGGRSYVKVIEISS